MLVPLPVLPSLPSAPVALVPVLPAPSLFLIFFLFSFFFFTSSQPGPPVRRVTFHPNCSLAPHCHIPLSIPIKADSESRLRRFNPL